MPKRFLFQPITPFVVGQKFGQNTVCMDIATGTKFISCDGKNPPLGYRSVYTEKGHTGIDLPSLRWNPVYAAYDGVVVQKNTDEKTGLGVALKHFVDGKYYITKYWHLAAIDVDMGESVKLGDFLGYADNTGWSSGDHLHFEVGTCNQFMGEYTQVDPEPLLYPTFALSAKNKISWIREQLALIADKLADLARSRL